MSQLVLRNGTLVYGDRSFVGDIVIEEGKIVEVGEGLNVNGGKVVECEGKYVLPGLIDVHVHFREPGQGYKEDWQSGSRAAVAGGVTTVCDMPNNEPPILSVSDLETKRALISGRSYVNYGLYMGYNGKNLDEIGRASNVAAVKLYHAHSTGEMGVSGEMVEALFANAKMRIVAHAEDEECISERRERLLVENSDVSPVIHSQIRASECAVRSVERLCELAGRCGARLHVAHVSTEAELKVIEQYRDRGITCEVAPHHLFLSDEDYGRLGNFLKVNPPVRSMHDTYAMWQGLRAGLIDIIATDHAPHTIEEKEREYREAPAGMPELDTLLPLLLGVVNDEGISLSDVVRWCCERPAALFGMKSKGELKVGYDADIVVVDLDLEARVTRERLHTKCGWSPYEGRALRGWPVMTFVNGVLVYSDDAFVAGPCGREIDFE